MYDSMVMYNFNIIGTIKFSVQVLDRGVMSVDFTDAHLALDLEDTAS